MIVRGVDHGSLSGFKKLGRAASADSDSLLWRRQSRFGDTIINDVFNFRSPFPNIYRGILVRVFDFSLLQITVEPEFHSGIFTRGIALLRHVDVQVNE